LTIISLSDMNKKVVKIFIECVIIYMIKNDCPSSSQSLLSNSGIHPIVGEK